MTSETVRGVTPPVVDALVQVSFAVLDVLGRCAAQLDLSVTQMRLLGILRDRTPSMATVAGFLRLDRSSVSGLIDRAERRGLVVRRTSATDARVTIIELTPAGVDVGEQIATIVSVQLEKLLDGVTPADRDRFVHLAESIVGMPID